MEAQHLTIIKFSKLITFSKKTDITERDELIHESLEIEQREIDEEVDEIRTHPWLSSDLRDVELIF